MTLDAKRAIRGRARRCAPSGTTWWRTTGRPSSRDGSTMSSNHFRAALALGEETRRRSPRGPGVRARSSTSRTTPWTPSRGPIEAGYDGGSFKSCKGVFKGVANACRIEQLRREDPGRALIYSAEDLSTIGPVGLLADLAVIATLGIDEPERNGYHYLRDLTSLSPRVDEETHALPSADLSPGRTVIRSCGSWTAGSRQGASSRRPSASAGAATSRTSCRAPSRCSPPSRRARKT